MSLHSNPESGPVERPQQFDSLCRSKDGVQFWVALAVSVAAFGFAIAALSVALVALATVR